MAPVPACARDRMQNSVFLAEVFPERPVVYAQTRDAPARGHRYRTENNGACRRAPWHTSRSGACSISSIAIDGASSGCYAPCNARPWRAGRAADRQVNGRVDVQTDAADPRGATAGHVEPSPHGQSVPAVAATRQYRPSQKATQAASGATNSSVGAGAASRPPASGGWSGSRDGRSLFPVCGKFLGIRRPSGKWGRPSDALRPAGW